MSVVSIHFLFIFNLLLVFFVVVFLSRFVFDFLFYIVFFSPFSFAFCPFLLSCFLC